MKSTLQLTKTLESNFEFHKPVSDSSSAEICSEKKIIKNYLKSLKKKIIKLHPYHWFDGVWTDLEFKM